MNRGKDCTKPAVIGRLPKHKGNAAYLGSASYCHTVEREDTPAVRGMVNAVSFRLKLRSKRCV
ncbi:50S ribosomal protein L30 [Salmonella enterica subsp. enterica]|nr:50S ribosomal protein L30 [Salmonella enterica subsp. enterica]